MPEPCRSTLQSDVLAAGSLELITMAQSHFETYTSGFYPPLILVSHERVLLSQRNLPPLVITNPETNNALVIFTTHIRHQLETITGFPESFGEG